MIGFFQAVVVIAILYSADSMAACPLTDPSCAAGANNVDDIPSVDDGLEGLEPGSRPSDVTEIISNSSWAFEGVSLFGMTIGKASAPTLYDACVKNNEQSCNPLPQPYATSCQREVTSGCRGAVSTACTTYINQRTAENPGSCSDVWRFLGEATGCKYYVGSPCASADPDLVVVDDDTTVIDDPNINPPGGGGGGGGGAEGTLADDDSGAGETQTNLGNGRVPSSSMQQGADRLAQVCLQSFADANKCCNDPMSCLGVNPTQATAEPQGIQEACQMMMDAGSNAQSINAAGAYVCDANKNGCLDSCQVSRDQIRQMIQAECGYDPATGHGNCQGLQQSYDLTVSRQVSCSAFSTNVQAMSQQAAHSQSSQQMAERCQQASTSPTAIDAPATSSSTDSDGFAKAGVLDAPSSTSQQEQQRSKMEFEPTNSTPDFGSRPSSGFGGDIENPGQNLQPAFGQTLNQQAASSKGVPSNGGGFTGGSSGGSGYGGGGGGAKSAGSGGYNTDVLRGVGGGSGYSNPVGRNKRQNSMGGFRLPSSTAPAAAKPSSKFDLKRFLPGGSLDPKRRLAGSSSSQIGPSHGDIWVQLSNRVRELCRLKKLMDCGAK